MSSVLTNKQIAALDLIANGLSKKEAAHYLGITPSAVESRLRKASEALRAKNLAHATLIAIAKGEISIKVDVDD